MPKATYCRKEAFELFRAQMPCIETTQGLLRAATAISFHHLDAITMEQVEGVIDTRRCISWPGWCSMKTLAR